MRKLYSIWKVRRLRRVIALQRCTVRPGITHVVNVSDRFIDDWQTCVTYHECIKCRKSWW